MVGGRPRRTLHEALVPCSLLFTSPCVRLWPNSRGRHLTMGHRDLNSREASAQAKHQRQPPVRRCHGGRSAAGTVPTRGPATGQTSRRASKWSASLPFPPLRSSVWRLAHAARFFPHICLPQCLCVVVALPQFSGPARLRQCESKSRFTSGAILLCSESRTGTASTAKRVQRLHRRAWHRHHKPTRYAYGHQSCQPFSNIYPGIPHLINMATLGPKLS